MLPPREPPPKLPPPMLPPLKPEDLVLEPPTEREGELVLFERLLLLSVRVGAVFVRLSVRTVLLLLRFEPVRAGVLLFTLDSVRTGVLLLTLDSVRTGALLFTLVPVRTGRLLYTD